MAELPTTLTPLILKGHVPDVLRSLPDRSVRCVVTSSPYWNMRDYSACSCSVQKFMSEDHRLMGANREPGNGGNMDPFDPRCRKEPDPNCQKCGGTGTIPGINDQVWGGRPDCAHEWKADSMYWDNRHASVIALGESDGHGSKKDARGKKEWATCSACGAWRGQYGMERTPYEFVEHTLMWCDEIYRVLQDDGTFWYNIADSAVGSGRGPTGKNGIMSHSERQGFTESPAWKGDGKLKAKDLALIPERVLIGLQGRGWYVRSKIAWCKPNPPRSSAKDRPGRSWEPIFQLTKSDRYLYNEEAVRQPYSESTRKEVGISYRNESTKMYERQKAQDPSDTKRRIIESLEERGGSMLPDAWWFPPSSYKGSHTATFPNELPKICILASSNPGDIVLDPFAGSGTTLEEARRNRRRSVGIEISSEYQRLIEGRLASERAQQYVLTAFADPLPVDPSVSSSPD
jgi:DNA modification methylase